jgi:phage terminase Nu1 subunit (DNA packaging protein)
MTDDDDLADLFGPSPPHLSAAKPRTPRKAKAARGRPAGRPPLPPDDPLKAARARAAEASANWNELKAAKLEGELVEAAAVAARYAEIVADARARLLAVPARVGAKLPHLTVPDLATLEAELRAALTDLADGDRAGY